MGDVVSGALGAVVGIAETLIGGKKKVQGPPPAQIPAAPAPARRDDTGAQIRIGADAAGDERVSGRGKGRKRTSGSVLGGLSRGSGLSL